MDHSVVQIDVLAGPIGDRHQGGTSTPRQVWAVVEVEKRLIRKSAICELNILHEVTLSSLWRS